MLEEVYEDLIEYLDYLVGGEDGGRGGDMEEKAEYMLTID